MLAVVRAVDADARDPDRAGDLAAVPVQLLEVVVARLLGVLQAAVDERVERLGRDRVAAARVCESGQNGSDPRWSSAAWSCSSRARFSAIGSPPSAMSSTRRAKA